MIKALFTIGYAGIMADKLVQLSADLDAVVIDIRLQPGSKKVGFNKQDLQKLIPAGYYLHIPELGNVCYQVGGIEIASVDVGCGKVIDILQTRRCILMCGCLLLERCHRKVVSEEICKRLPLIFGQPPKSAELCAPKDSGQSQLAI